ncbi:hypothetical protein T492DRAFT_1071794 [Pavlovales sp. CCMP2436]|nr:hypothetical protein T492DRAFT_1071794 [Pavlovales sp. CCMP2436]
MAYGGAMGMGGCYGGPAAMQVFFVCYFMILYLQTWFNHVLLLLLPTFFGVVLQ